MSTNKKNLITSLVSLCPIPILLIEHLCGLELALECMYICIGLAVIIHIGIFRDYIRWPRIKKERK